MRIQINYFQRFDGYAGTSKGVAYGRVSSRLECQVYIKILLSKFLFLILQILCMFERYQNLEEEICQFFHFRPTDNACTLFYKPPWCSNSPRDTSSSFETWVPADTDWSQSCDAHSYINNAHYKAVERLSKIKFKGRPAWTTQLEGGKK